MSPSRLLRTVAAVSFLGLAVTLSACQTPPPVDSSKGPVCVGSGSASQQLEVVGELGSIPEVTFPAGLSAAETERVVVVEGDGVAAEQGSLVTVDFVAFNAADGAQIEASGYGAAGVGYTQIHLDDSESMAGLRRALICSTVGSRVAAVIPPGDALGVFGGAAGLGDADSIVAVFDVLAVAGEYADGESVALPPAFPTVTTGTDNAPRVAVPAEVPPATFEAALSKRGDGLAVRAGSDVVVKYRGVLWRNGLTFEENWTQAHLESYSLSEFFPAVATSLVGQTVGSELVVVVPPASGFGPDGDQSGTISGTDTLVYVIDILATT